MLRRLCRPAAAATARLRAAAPARAMGVRYGDPARNPEDKATSEAYRKAREQRVKTQMDEAVRHAEKQKREERRRAEEERASRRRGPAG